MLLEPLITAVCTAVRELAGIEAAVQLVYQKALNHALGDIAAVIQVGPANEGALVLGFPQRTAAALAAGMLAGVTREVDESLIRDCVGEIANVVAGQAKALFADSPYRLALSLPQVVISAQDFRPPPGQDPLVVAFSSAQGDFTLQLFMKR
jgi:chemotaxis protein CheX